MPRFAPPVAPKCAKCGTSVFHVEQAMGPMGKLYHKPCLACVVCNKRLDSTLLVEHDGEPYCKNCHKEHLGTGKGGFNTAVALNPISPKASSVSSNTNSPGVGSTPTRSFASPRSSVKPLYSPRSPSPVKTSYATGLEDEGVPAISVRSRGAPVSPPALPSKASSRQYTSSRSTTGTPIRSIDEAVSSRSADIRDPVSRLADSVGGIDLQPETPSRRTQDAQQASAPLPSANYYDTPSPASTRLQEPFTGGSPAAASAWSNEDEQAPIITTRRISAADTMKLGGSNPHSSPSARVNAASPLSSVGGLPPPRRPDPSSLTGASGTAKIAPPRMTTNPNTAAGSGFGREDSDSSVHRSKGGIDRLGLGSIITDAGGGTPLCARCQKPVYFAEQKAAAGRKWHRGCLRCDGCSTTLDTGKLEEGPADRTYQNGNKMASGGANIWCRVCYAKYFGPKNLAVGFSLPEAMP